MCGSVRGASPLAPNAQAELLRAPYAKGARSGFHYDYGQVISMSNDGDPYPDHVALHGAASRFLQQLMR
jgi:hypothetical protein